MAGHPRTRASTRRPPSGGGSTTAVDAHVAAADPHTTYLKEADAASTYATAGHNHSGVYAPVSHTHAESDVSGLTAALAAKQATLVSATNIKTVNGASLLGAGDLTVASSAAWGAITGTLSAQTDLNSALAGKSDTSHTHAGVYAPASHTHAQSDVTNLTTDLAGKQASLVSGTNIKSLNGSTLLGSGDRLAFGYALTAGGASASPADGATLYCGALYSLAPDTSSTRGLYVPIAGTIVAAALYMRAGTIGSAENISVYIRKNNTTDTLVQTVGVSNAVRTFINSSLSISVAAGDYVEFKGVCPTWATNPATCTFHGTIVVRVD